MSKLTVIFGPQGSGKSQMVVALTRGKKTLFLNAERIENPFCFEALHDKEAECVVFDEYPLDKLDWIVGIQRSETMTVDKRGVEPKIIKTPKIYVVIWNNPSPEEVMAVVGGRNFQLIECKRKEVGRG